MDDQTTMQRPSHFIEPRSKGPPSWYPERGMSYGDWYQRERTAGRHTRPKPDSQNADTTPLGFEHYFPIRRRGLMRRIVGAVGGNF